MKIKKSLSPICVFFPVSVLMAVLCFDKQPEPSQMTYVCGVYSRVHLCYDLFIWFCTLSHNNLNNYSSGKFQMRTICHEIARCKHITFTARKEAESERKRKRKRKHHEPLKAIVMAILIPHFLCATE